MEPTRKRFEVDRSSTGDRIAALLLDAEEGAEEIYGGAAARADEIIAHAHERANTIIRAAEIEAERIRLAAHDEADDTIFTANLQKQEIADDLAEIERRRMAAVRGLERVAKALREASG